MIFTLNPDLTLAFTISDLGRMFIATWNCRYHLLYLLQSLLSSGREVVLVRRLDEGPRRFFDFLLKAIPVLGPEVQLWVRVAQRHQ